MLQQHWKLIAFAVVLAGASVYLNLDRFGKEIVKVHHRSRPARLSAGGSAADPIFFVLDRSLQLSSIQVIPVHEIATNKYPHPIWHLVSDSNSVLTADFAYGESIGGMRPAVQGAVPDPLEPGVNYRLVVKAGVLKLEHDFVPVARIR